MKKDEIYYTPEGSPVGPSKFDKRVILRNRSRGSVTTAELKQHLVSLPDEAEHGITMEFDVIVGDEKEVVPGGTTH